MHCCNIGHSSKLSRQLSLWGKFSFTFRHYLAVKNKLQAQSPLLTHLWVVSNRHNDSDSHFDGLVSRNVHHAALLHPISASPCVWRTVQTLLTNAAAICGKETVVNDTALSCYDEYSRHYSSTNFIETRRNALLGANKSGVGRGDLRYFSGCLFFLPQKKKVKMCAS
jgi:hypothetical protein